jgi:hypothetical protein
MKLEHHWMMLPWLGEQPRALHPVLLIIQLKRILLYSSTFTVTVSTGETDPPLLVLLCRKSTDLPSSEQLNSNVSARSRHPLDSPLALVRKEHHLATILSRLCSESQALKSPKNDFAPKVKSPKNDLCQVMSSLRKDHKKWRIK